MITEDYVSFETAKLLKEKGFDEKCRALYTFWFDEVEGPKEDEAENWNIEPKYFSAPTLQMAMKWLREKRCIIVVNPTWFTADGCKKWSFSIWADDNLEVDGENPAKRTEYDSYEEACEVAIRYCLENLI